MKSLRRRSASWEVSRAAILACVTICLLLLVGATAIASPGWTVQQLTNSPADDTRPRVSQNWVTWVRDSEIYLTNLAAGPVIRLTNNTIQDEQPDVTTRNVVWSRFDGSGWKIQLWDRRKNSRDELGYGWWPTLSRDFAAWSYQAPSSNEVYVTSIPFMSGATVNPLTTNAISDEYPSLGRDVLAWERGGGLIGTEEIMAFDLHAWTNEAQITNNSVSDGRPSTDGRHIVWSRWDGVNDGEIFIHDLDSGLTSQLTNDSAEDYAPVVSGRRVAWLSGGMDPSLKVYDLVSGTTTVVAASLGSLTDTPDIDGSRIVWERKVGGNQEVFTAWYNSFPDVDPLSLNYFAIQWMADEGAINGYLNGDFGPLDPVRRAQFAKMIVGVLGIPVDESLIAPFPDLGPDDPNDLYPHDYVAAAAAAGIIRGKTTGDFDPWAYVTRAQAVTMAMRAASDYWGLPLPALPSDYTGTLNFTDPDHGYKMRQAEYVYLLEDIVGFNPGWNPWDPACRAEIAQVLWALNAELRE